MFMPRGSGETCSLIRVVPAVGQQRKRPFSGGGAWTRGGWDDLAGRTTNEWAYAETYAHSRKGTAFRRAVGPIKRDGARFFADPPLGGGGHGMFPVLKHRLISYARK